MFRLPPGGDAQFFLRQNTCTGCHSLSGNGARLLASEALGTNGNAYSIAPNTAPNPQPSRVAVAASFAGLSPDGSVYVGTAALNGVGPRNGGPVQVQSNATLYETDTGAVRAEERAALLEAQRSVSDRRRLLLAELSLHRRVLRADRSVKLAMLAPAGGLSENRPLWCIRFC